ncbi:hypothetical protein ACLKA7_010744 [Drosophila subpalustris]
MGRFDNPFQGFGTLAKQYGDIYSLTLGHTRCLIVNNLDLIREVLNKNGKFFGGRPNFLRYDKLFGGDRNNSLALCNWSQLQQKRRNLARRHCSPRESTSYFTKMSTVGCHEIDHLIDRLKNEIVPGQPIDIKPIINAACANMFCQYMCSKRFDYEDVEFKQFVRFFDEIFWEINQGHPLDFLPWLLPFYTHHLNRISYWSRTIRKFILDRVINEREPNVDPDEPDTDFTDVLLKSLIENKNMSHNTIIFMLEDFLGGHSAVGNLVMLALSYIAKNPNIGTKIQCEVDIISNTGERSINLSDMSNMPFTMATIFEVLRYSSSPIVPHVATEDTVVSGFGVTTDVDVLTTGILAELVNGILDFLLFHRSQIPFVYKTYKYYVEKWDETNATTETAGESFRDYQLQKQRFLAKETKKSISNMREIIRSAFKSSKAVKSLRFLFGNNTFMPTESYTIHIPHKSISKNHGDIHAMPEGPLNQTLLGLLTCEELYTLWSTELKTTNVFLELELLTSDESEQQRETLKLYPKDVVSQLPRSCKNVHLHLLHVNESAGEELTCCKELVIYQDFDFLSLDSENAKENVSLNEEEHNSGWWQSDIIVRGFRAPKYDLWSS